MGNDELHAWQSHWHMGNLIWIMKGSWDLYLRENHPLLDSVFAWRQMITDLLQRNVSLTFNEYHFCWPSYNEKFEALILKGLGCWSITCPTLDKIKCGARCSATEFVFNDILIQKFIQAFWFTGPGFNGLRLFLLHLCSKSHRSPCILSRLGPIPRPSKRVETSRITLGTLT